MTLRELPLNCKFRLVKNDKVYIKMSHVHWNSGQVSCNYVSYRNVRGHRKAVIGQCWLNANHEVERMDYTYLHM